MKDIYLIQQSEGSYDDRCTHICGWVGTEEEAKAVCKKLDDAIPQCPLASEKDVQKMEDFLDDWWEVESDYLETHQSPYTEPVDGTDLKRVTDTRAHSEWVDEQNKELNRMRTEWFKHNIHAQDLLPKQFTWESFLVAWDSWKDETYIETNKAYYTKVHQL